MIAEKINFMTPTRKSEYFTLFSSGYKRAISTTEISKELGIKHSIDEDEYILEKLERDHVYMVTTGD
ncbi:hypothetical protein ABE402_14820 [Bacillus smithii]|uniref:hypothetical protein n=1 Tax=Bacillus smithii TaxID=1479 RepID=UPI003D24B0C5